MKSPSILSKFAAAALCLSPVSAVAMTVQPVLVDLTPSGQGMTQVITVENTFATPLPVEMRVEALQFDETGVKATGQDDGNLLVFPQQALIQPGQKQTFRVQWTGDPTLARSQHYYVTVAQLPVQLPDAQSAIQILYNFQILASVGATNKTPAISVLSSYAKREGETSTVLMDVQNTADTYGYLSQGRLTVVEKDSAGKEVFRRTLDPAEIQQTIGFGLIGPGQRRTLALPLALPQAEGGRVEVSFTPQRRR
jgi:fimbrial chaperone protein